MKKETLNSQQPCRDPLVNFYSRVWEFMNHKGDTFIFYGADAVRKQFHLPPWSSQRKIDTFCKYRIYDPSATTDRDKGTWKKLDSSFFSMFGLSGMRFRIKSFLSGIVLFILFLLCFFVMVCSLFLVLKEGFRFPG